MLSALLLMTAFCTAQAGRNVTNDVQAFIAKFHELNSTNDLIGSLEIIEERSRELFRLGYTIRSLVKAEVNTAKKAYSEKARAVMELRKLFSNEAFYDLHNSHYDDKNSYASLIYYQGITQQMAVMHKIMQALGHSSFLEQINNLRNSDFNPTKAMNSLDDFTHENCRYPEKEGIRNVIRMKDALLLVEARIEGASEEAKASWATFRKYNVLPWTMRSTVDEVNSLINNLTEIDAPIYESFERAYSMYAASPRYPIKSLCLLEVAMAECDFAQACFDSKLRKWHSDMLRIELFTWVLHSVSDIDEHSYSAETERVVKLLDQTGCYIACWAHQFQEVSWPDLGIQAVNVMLRSNIHYYNEMTANRVRATLETQCGPNYDFQVLIVRENDPDFTMSVLNKQGGNYFNITGHEGTAIHVFRSSKAEAQRRGANAKQWMEDNKEQLMQQMRDGALTNTTVLLSQLHQRHPISYPSVVLMKSAGAPRASYHGEWIKVGAAINEKASYKLATNVTKYTVPGSETIYTFKAFFLL